MNENDKTSLSKEELIQRILEKDKDLNGSNINEELMHELISGKISKNINETDDKNSTLGQRAADKIAADPYPFVFLNLVLSCLAAIQAPIIMMSQNRQSEKDRLTAANDYLVNLKSEIIIEDLHYKIDMLMDQQEKNTKTIEILLKTIEESKKIN